MARNNVEVRNNVQLSFDKSSKWMLHLQECTYHLSDETEKWQEEGLRFIWSNDGRLCGHRGQARIPDVEAMFKLITMAMVDGWLRTPDNVTLTIG